MSRFKTDTLFDEIFPPKDETEAAKAERDKALQLVESRGADWQFRTLLKLPRLSGFTGTWEAIRLELKRMLDYEPPHTPNAWGACCRDAIRKGLIVATGERGHMITKKSHARKTDIYRVR